MDCQLGYTFWPLSDLRLVLFRWAGMSWINFSGVFRGKQPTRLTLVSCTLAAPLLPLPSKALTFRAWAWCFVGHSPCLSLTIGDAQSTPGTVKQTPHSTDYAAAEAVPASWCQVLVTAIALLAPPALDRPAPERLASSRWCRISVIHTPQSRTRSSTCSDVIRLPEQWQWQWQPESYQQANPLL